MCEHGGTDNRDLLDTLRAAVDTLRAAGGVALSGAVGDVELTQAVQLLEAAARVCEGQKLRLVRELDQRHAAKGQAAGSTAELLARVLHLSQGEARRETELAEGLAALPDTQKALADGRIGVAQAHVAVKKAAEVKDRADGELLVKQIDATAASAGQLMDRNRLAREIDTELAKADMDVLADRERTAFQRRSLSWTVRDGMHVLHAELDAVGGATVRAMLDRLSTSACARPPRGTARRLSRGPTLARGSGTLSSPWAAPQQGRHIPQYIQQSAHAAQTPPRAPGTGNRPSTRDAQAGPRRLPGTRVRPRAQQAPTCQACVAGTGRGCSRCGNGTRRRLRGTPASALGGWAAPEAGIPRQHATRRNRHTHIHQLGWQITRDNAGRYRAGPPDLGPPHLENSIAIHTHAYAHTS